MFRMDDHEWWAGESLDACVAEGKHQCGPDCYGDSSDQWEVSDEAMQSLKFIDEDGSVRPFAEELARLIASGAEFPCAFAADDW